MGHFRSFLPESATRCFPRTLCYHYVKNLKQAGINKESHSFCPYLFAVQTLLCLSDPAVLPDLTINFLIFSHPFRLNLYNITVTLLYNIPLFLAVLAPRKPTHVPRPYFQRIFSPLGLPFGLALRSMSLCHPSPLTLRSSL